jgi:hypothetical protein
MAGRIGNPTAAAREAGSGTADKPGNDKAPRLPYPVIDDPRSFNVPVNIAKMLSEEFELIQETEGYPFDLKRPYQAGDDAWLGIFRRIPRNAT